MSLVQTRLRIMTWKAGSDLDVCDGDKADSTNNSRSLQGFVRLSVLSPVSHRVVTLNDVKVCNLSM